MRPENLTKRKDALEILFKNWEPQRKVVVINTADAVGFVLAEDQYAKYTLPVVRAAGMDGIAFNFDQYENGEPDTENWQLGVEYVRADTGDDFSDDYDTVVPVEWVTFHENGGITIQQHQPISRGMHIRGAGSTIKIDRLVLEKGTVLKSHHLAALASGGIAQIPVVAKPKVAFIPTGSELVALGTEPERGQNIDSNTILAKAMLEEMGAEPVCYPIIKDKKEDLADALEKALNETDFIIINAGSSKGSEDFNTRLISEKGQLLFHEVAAVPGRPMGAGIIQGKAVINLAGPPMAAFYGLDWIIRAMICRWLEIDMPERLTVEAILEEDMHTPPPLELMMLMDLKEEDGIYKVTPYGRGETGSRLPAMAANAMYVSKLGEKGYKKGEKITVQVL